MRAIILSVVVSALSLVACGGSEPPPAAPSNTAATAPSDKAFAGAETSGKGEAVKGEGHHDGKGGHDDHGKMSPALHEMHETLSPIWHTAAGNDRVTKTCSGEKSLRDRAGAVGDAELTASADAVKAACDKPGKTEVEAKLSTMHDRFHKLVEQAKDKK